MKIYRCLLWLIFTFELFFGLGCKKIPEHKLSPTIKEYFTFKPGSYWIYRNDSTGDLDSTTVKYFSNHFLEDEEHSSKWEVVVIDFRSVFLKRLSVFINSCQQIDYTAVEGRNLQGNNSDGGVLYYPEWPQKQVIIPECEPGVQYYYTILAADTLNNQIYSDVLYTELISIDSTFERYFFRRIAYSPFYGILKYYDLNKQININSSFTLIRCKIIK